MQILEQVQDLPKAGNIKAQWVSLWTGPAVGAVLLVALLAFPGFWPPMSPQLPAEQVAAFYAENTAWIRFSQVTFNLCGIMILPFFMVIVVQMKRMKTQSHVFAYCYLTAVVSGATIFALSNIFFLVAAFRPDRSPELVMLLNDLAWIVFIAPVGMVLTQFVLLALAVYFDDGPDPVFPRWVGHYSLATGIAMIPAVGAAVFQTGPLAWDGLLAFWLRNGAFAAFVVVMFFVLRRAVLRQAQEEGVIA
ncbi:Uncharacterised protein [Mycolicibacterium phlei]|uniref:Membrane protein n=1 Tax=Mycolicibacterium phlei DSM 43239 = CCUG 21000 TaxID=1226750 RepID=A0A5N5V0W2_MYCPH|nr:hypothetical protein [Mycolicibacterium phlei]VEG11919.1 Uncharacterised protein [Mycobacteroides chelonae]AMO63828.1 hypothetical protein MPHLCCUG_05043 [Mycolicibacterium phlei]KAB7754777.1 membrane protein [Mycolicibacterium phlei DSM 43239 = CCUG 21000]KXW65422.1 membrane protein [Mycolicibacterium phlei DSM 43239 = CCUG 21000]KXW69459.1 membrane protein [Mycolicibacterium phlei DSM 43070]